MLKEVIISIINKALGKYVENFDSSQFQLGLGDIVFNNLELKQNCFDDLDIPISVLYGKIGKLSIKLSYLKFFSSPSIIEIDELFLLAVPNQHSPYNEEAEKKYAQEAKEAQLQRVEDSKKKVLEKAQGVQKPPVNKSLIEKIASTFIKNIEVKIRNIHLRFEDRISNHGKPFAFGVTLSSLNVKTVPPWGEEVTDPLNLIFKELTISWLCLYWNSKEKLFQFTVTVRKKDMETEFKKGVGSENNVPQSYKYLLGPINAKSNLRINLYPELDRTNFAIPKFSLNFVLEGLLISMTKLQYQDLILFLETLSFMKTATQYRKYRPAVMMYKGQAKVWWKFAYTCIVEEIRRKRKEWDWEQIKRHRQIFRDYTKAYHSNLKNPNKVVARQLKFYEEDLDVLNLVLARQLAERELAQEVALPVVVKPKEAGFFSRWFGGSGGSPTEKESGDFLPASFTSVQEVLSPDERDEMYKAIGYTEGETPTDYPDFFVEFDLSATICKIEIKLFDEEKVNVMTVTIKEALAAIQQRPASKSLTLHFSIEQFIITGLYHNNIMPVLLTTKTNVSKEKPLVKVLFETNPLDNKRIDQRIYFDAEPLIIIYDALTINNLLKLFKVQENTVASKIQAAAQAKLQEFKEVSALGLQNMLEHHMTMEIRATIQASSVVIPQTGLFTVGRPMLAITLGNINVISLPRKEFVAKDAVKQLDSDSLEYLMAYSYDNFELHLTDLQVVFAQATEDWSKPTQDMYFLKPTSLIIDLGKCLVPDDARLPKLKVKGQLLSIHIAVSDLRIKECLELLMSIPLPESSVPLSDVKYEEPLFRHSFGSIKRLSSSTTQLNYEKPENLLITTKHGKPSQMIQAFEFDAKFELKEVVIEVMVVNNDKIWPLLQFQLKNLETVITQHTFVTAVQLKLNSVQLRHYFENEWLNFIITYKISDKEDYLFIVNYQNVDKNIPEFHTKYKSTLQLVEVDFTKIELMLHCEALKDLMVWAENFQKAFKSEEEIKEKEEKKFSSENQIYGTHLAIKGSRVDLKENRASLTSGISDHKSSRCYQVDEIKIKIKARLGEIGITLWKNKSHLSSLGITGGECVLGVKTTYTQIDLKLRGIYMFDHSLNTLYKKVLTSDKYAEVLSLRYVQFENVDKISGGVDMSVELNMAAIKFVFINKFIMSQLDFLNHFSAAREAIIDASAAAAEAAKQNVQSALKNSIRISLKIDLEAPKIIIPVSFKTKKAFILDLGQLSAHNSFMDVKVPNSEESAVLDRLYIDLQNVQLNRVELGIDSDEVVKSHAIIEPLSFKVTIQRNLSSGWFLEVPDIEVGGKLQTIKITINKSDYLLIMQMLEENIGDTGLQEANLKPPAKGTSAQKKKISSLGGPSYEDKIIVDEKHTVVRSSLKFTMTLESLVLELVNTDSNIPDVKESLTKLSLELVSMKGSMMSDESIHFAIILLDLTMDDTRPTKIGKISRYMQRKKGRTEGTKSMIDITYQQKPDAKFADVRISSIDLILNLDHLTQVANFFSKLSEASPATIEEIKVTTKSVDQLKNKQAAEEKEVELGRTSINFKVEHPDIILVENIDDTDTNALVLDFELTITANFGTDKSLITGSLTDLQLFTCCYNPAKRKETKAPVLNPVSFLVSGCGDEGNIKLELDATRIKVSVTPGVIMLLGKVVTSLTSGAKAIDEEKTPENIDRFNLWEISDFNDIDYPFLKAEVAEDALDEINEGPGGMVKHEPMSIEKKMEFLTVKITQITITLEAGFGRSTMPLLFLESRLDVTVSDWSSGLHMDGKLFLQMSYYNSYHAMWEPLLEPVSHSVDTLKTEQNPWMIKVLLNNCAEEDLEEPTNAGKFSGVKGTALTLISVESEDILNITVSKKSLEVITGLSDSLSAAIFRPQEYEGEKSPYVVKNESGLSVKILLDDEFVVYSESDPVEVKYVVLDHDSYVGLKSSSEIEYLGLSEETKEKFIHIMVTDYKCDIHIPVLKSAKRFFLLGHRGPGNDQWGLVTDVMLTNGQTMVTLRGVIQVQNMYNIPINIYSMTHKENELHLIGTVDPKESLNLPLESIYTQTTELFFSADGYTVSIVPYIWKDLQNCIQKVKILKCNPKSKDNTEPLFLRVDGELEQIFFENTSRHTMLSTCFKLCIRPTVTFKNVLPIDVVVLIQGIEGEHIVLPAMTIQIPTAEPGTSSIVVRIPSYLDREWSCKHELSEDPPELSVWRFDSFESDKHISIDLGMHMELSQGTHQYTLYCPFWMINKTGLQLAYKRSSKVEKETSSPEHSDEANTLYHPPEFTGVILFSFRAKSFFVKKKSSIRVFDGPWSEKFSLDAVGSSGVVICKYGEKTFNIGVKIQLSNNALTKEVVFTPFYVFINKFKIHSIDVRERTATHEFKWTTIKPENCDPFWPCEKPDTSKLEVRITGTKETTILFPFNISYNTVSKLSNKFGAIDVDVQLSDGGVFISFYPYEVGMAPVLVMNHTDYEVDFCDKAVKNTRTILKPRQKVLFTWEKLDDPHYTLSFCGGGFTTTLKEDNMGHFPLKKQAQLYWSSFLYGPQRVFLITSSQAIAADSINLTDYEIVSQAIELSFKGIGLSVVDNSKKSELLYISISSSDVVWEARKPYKKTFKKLSPGDSEAIEQAYKNYIEYPSFDLDSPLVKVNNRITVDFRNMKMIQPSEKDIHRCYVDGLWVNLKLSSHLTRIHLKINSFQIDQQVYDCVFPVIFAPVPPPKSIMTLHTPKPFIEVSIVKMINQFSHLQQFKYLGILIQEFHLRADTGFLTNLMDFIKGSEPSEQAQVSQMDAEIKRAHEPLYFFVSQSAKMEQKNYYSQLHLSPLKIHMSFSLSSGDDPGGEKESSMPPIVSLFMHSFGVTLTDVDDVLFKINCFERDALFVTQSQLISEVQGHYVSQFLQQIYVLILGLDVIGNPFGLIAGLKTGATDLFYEPIQGAIRGPGEFAEGLVLGVRSLFGHTVGGAAGAVSKMTGALGKGLAALTFDDDYQRQRREMQRSKPATVQEGFARSGKGLVMGVIEGVGGVVTKPISGAKEEGVSGFFKGVGKGMVGLITRPTAGIVDFASGSLGAVRRAAEVSSELPRKRFPRYIRPDGLIKPYCMQEAEGNKYLQELDKGKYAKTDEYLFHMPIGYATKYKDVLLLTDRRMIYLAYNEIFGGYQLDWGHKWSQIVKEPEAVKDGIKFWVDKKSTLKTFFTTPDAGKILFIENLSIRSHVLEVMKEMISKNSENNEKGSNLSIKSSEVLQWIFLFALVIVRGETNLLGVWLNQFPDIVKRFRNRQP